MNLRTAGDFTLLAKTGISTTGVTAIIGDAGVSPSAASFFTGFGQSLDVSATFATSAKVNGRLYAADYATPTPAKMTQAVLDMEAAYTDAASRANPTAVELRAGLIDGVDFVPGVYKWSSVVSFPKGITLTGGANDVWVFQIAQGLTLGSGAVVTLAGGAQAKNVFWQVAGKITLGTTSRFYGIALCKTAIVIQTNAVMVGRALAQSAVTLDAATVTAP